MSDTIDLEFFYIGWCKEVKNGVNSDKVWAAFRVGPTHYAVWGARGKKLSFKDHGPSRYSTLQSVINKKQRDYEEVDAFQLFTVFPFFKDDVEKYLLMSVLTGQVR